MKAEELRQKFLDFFKEKGHTIIPSASLIPKEDPTVLFTTAGMHPLVPYLLGEKHPGGQRVTSAQKCIRTVDIDEVGDTTHHTFFEMLGNWSFGDSSTTLGAGYFKKEAIEWSWEFLTDKKWLGLDKNRLAISVFAGDQDAPFDEESFNIWRNLGVPEKRIAKLPKKNNWWGPAGETGPCGPDTEMFYWVGDTNKVPNSFNDDNDLWVEIWNDVFMEYNKKVKDEKQIEYKLLKERKEKIPDDFFEYVKLSQRNVDTGMGLERVLAVMNGQDDNYRTELFWPLIEKIEELSGKQYNSPQPPLILREGDEITRAMRIIADHLRTATFILAEGIEPSNLKQGYVLRKLIRRAVRYSKPLSIDSIFTSEIARVVIKIYTDVYPELQKNKEFIVNQLIKEEEKFRSVLEAGLKKIQRLIEKKEKEMEGALLVEDRGQVIPPSEFLINVVSPKEAFDLYQNDGFPLEMINEELAKHGLSIDTKEFNEEFKRHQELSRTASVGMFKGGLADAGEQAARLHTATHLLQAALRKVLGEHVAQKGSNITAERLRFDFSHDKKMTSEEIKEVEDLVNEQIKKDIPVEMKEMTAEEAKKEGALGVFESKYDERVKVYSVNEFSKEICGGPHAKRTGELGKFGVVKEEASSAGVRRIKAVLE